LCEEEVTAPAGLVDRRRIPAIDQQNAFLALIDNSLIGDRQMSLDKASRSVAAVDQLGLAITQGTSNGDPDAVLVALGRKFDALSAELAMLQKQDDPHSSADMPSGDCGCQEMERPSLERIEAVLKSLDPIERAIMAIPARTVVGLGVKARHAAHVLSNYWTDAPEQLDWDARTVRLLIESACSVAGVGLLPMPQ
jgi:hypothetical protein